MKLKKSIKIVLGIVIFFTLPSLLYFGYIYIKYHEDLPVGIEGEAADNLANKMLDALDYQAFEKTKLIEWTHRNRRRYQWDKANNMCTVYWKEYKVDLHLKFPERSTASIHSFNVIDEQRDALVQTAIDYFNNDSFWMAAPYKVFDQGVVRKVVKYEGKEALLVTYTQGGSTPGDSYLWILDSAYMPIKFKMWTSLLPIDGLEATWTDWTTTESGAQLPTFHKILLMGVEMDHIKGTR